MRGTRPATICGVNAWVIRLRSCRCFGESIRTKFPLAKSAKSDCEGRSAPKSEENTAGVGQHAQHVRVAEYLPELLLGVVVDGAGRTLLAEPRQQCVQGWGGAVVRASVRMALFLRGYPGCMGCVLAPKNVPRCCSRGREGSHTPIAGCIGHTYGASSPPGSQSHRSDAPATPPLCHPWRASLPNATRPSRGARSQPQWAVYDATRPAHGRPPRYTRDRLRKRPRRDA